MIIWTRPFNQSDANPISEIVGEAFTEVYPNHIWADIASYWPDGLVVMLDDGDVVGAAVGVAEPDGTSRILILVLKPAYRSRGLGKVLLERHYEACRKRGISKVKLEVRHGNEGAMRFYGRNGYKLEGKLPCFYTDGADAWQMSKTI
ncbi:MAG: GNAT family N-acetyltransferase [Methanobacteriota archaeon]